MKITVFSDSHGHTEVMGQAMFKIAAHISAAVHLGDNAADADGLIKLYGSIPFYRVAGNCDGFFARGDAPESLTVELGGVKCFITHGHNYSVKRGYDKLKAKSAAEGARVCMFGHTHEPDLFRENGVLFVNPGSVSLPRGGFGPSYAVLDINGGEIQAAIIHKVGAVFKILYDI